MPVLEDTHRAYILIAPSGHFESHGDQNRLMQPRILYLIGQLRLGGYERQLYYLLQAIDRQRYRPAVAVWNAAQGTAFAEKIKALGVPLYTFSEHLAVHEKMMGLRRLVKALAPEVVHSYSFYTNFPAWWCTLGTNMISIGSIRNNFLSDRQQAGNILGRLSARWPSIQICNSLAAKQAVAEAAGPFKPSRLSVVPNGLDIQHFKATSDLPRTPQLLAVGRLYPQKRWDRLVEAVAQVHKRGLSFRVRHAGEGPLRQALEEQAKGLGVQHLFEFLGVRQDIPNLLAQSTFLVHTADEEGCPNVVMEAMACARAVVATDAGHCPALVEHGKTGFVVKRGDEHNLADCIATLIEHPDLALTMGQTGRVKVEQEFGLNQLVDRTVRTYAEAGWKV